MLVFLKNTLAQINVETRQGSAAVARVPRIADPAPVHGKTVPACVDAVTGGTQPIARYFAAQMVPRPQKPEHD